MPIVNYMQLLRVKKQKIINAYNFTKQFQSHLLHDELACANLKTKYRNSKVLLHYISMVLCTEKAFIVCIKFQRVKQCPYGEILRVYKTKILT
jgi:hypothetical protein